VKTITIELTDNRAFDDLINLDCIAEVLQKRIDDSADYDDQKVMRSWLKTIHRLRVVYEDAIMLPDSKDSLNRYRAEEEVNG